MRNTPFTVKADLDLGTRVTSYLVSSSADVSISEGEVPDALTDATSRGVSYAINDNQMLLSIPNGARFLIDSGERIVYERNGKSDREIALFLLGSAWGALCYQRSLLPLHASAIIVDGDVHAFTGPSGAGKSTLAAALAKRGRGFFTDDVLIIDPAEIGSKTVCYAGQKDLKLWKDALKLTGADKLGPVRDAEGFAKFYARPDHANDATVGTLSSLSLLTNGNERSANASATIERIYGGEALKQLRNSVYRPKFAASIWGLPKYYKVLAELIASVRVQAFDRTMDKKLFADGISALDQWIEQSPVDRVRVG